MPETPRLALLTTSEAADRLHVSDKTIRRWARVGVLPFIRYPSGRFRFNPDDVDAILASTGEQSA